MQLDYQSEAVMQRWALALNALGCKQALASLRRRVVLQSFRQRAGPNNASSQLIHGERYSSQTTAQLALYPVIDFASVLQAASVSAQKKATGIVQLKNFSPLYTPAAATAQQTKDQGPRTSLAAAPAVQAPDLVELLGAKKLVVVLSTIDLELHLVAIPPIEDRVAPRAVAPLDDR